MPVSYRSLLQGFLKKAVLPFALAWPLPGSSETLHYIARLHGVPLLDLSMCLQVGTTAYTASINARTVGVAEFLAHGRAQGHVSGLVDGTSLKPQAYEERSRLSGQDYAIDIDYPADNPVLRLQTPPQAKDRLPVPSGELAGAIDGLSAVALESLVATRTGGCQGAVLVYDGRQLRRATTHTGGHEILPQTAHAIYAGPALRCDTQSVMLAGFLKADAVGPQSRPRYSKVWLAPVVAGGEDVPVRVLFDADILGDIIVDLDRVSAQAAATCTATAQGVGTP
jgi:hypothetical protein